MGYYTAYSMCLLDPETQEVLSDEKYNAILPKVIDLLQKADVINYALDEYLDCNDTVTWYSYAEDVAEISRQIPDVLFAVHGDGDENGDIWDHYFLNGKSQRCNAEIKIPPFDQSKLE